MLRKFSIICLINSSTTKQTSRSQVNSSSLKVSWKGWQMKGVILFAAILCQLIFGAKCQENFTTQQPAYESNSSNFLNADGTISSGSGEIANNGNKLKPVNFTQVEEIFASALTDKEVVKKWQFMDSQLQDGMKSILKMIFPQIVAISQDAKVSGDCSGGILKWILSLRNLRSWAIKMLDATGKPTAGIFEGSLTMFGNQRQCLNIRAPDEDEIEITEQFEEYFRGQFCTIQMKPFMPSKRNFYNLNSTIDSLTRKNYKYYEKTLYDELAEIAVAFNFIDIRMDLCVPSICTAADIQRVADLMSKKLEMRSKVMRCDIAPKENSLFSSLDQVTLIWCGTFLLLVMVTMTATLVSLILGDSRHKLVILCHYLSFWSRRTDNNQTKQEKSNLVKGMRTLIVIWFMIVQMTVELNYQYLRESLTLRHMLMNYWPLQIIINSTYIYESLIVITGFGFAYSNLKSKLNGLLAYAFDRYMRLLVPMVLLVALTIATPLLSIWSPVWHQFVDEQSAVCKSTGFLNLFFLQNFITFDKVCLPHSWLLCVELQLIILSIPLLMILKKDFQTREDRFIAKSTKYSNTCPYKYNLIALGTSKLGLAVICLLAAGFVTNFVNVYNNNLPPSWFYTFPDVEQKNQYFSQYLAKTWTHLSVFVIGILAGHLCKSTLNLRNLRKSNSTLGTESASQSGITNMDSSSSNSSIDKNSHHSVTIQENNKKPYLKTVRVALIFACLVCLFGLVFSTFSWSTGELPGALIAAFYDASSRIIWASAMGTILTQISLLQEDDRDIKKLSLVSKILESSICHQLGRLSLLSYLLAPYVNTLVLAVAEQSLFPSLFMMFHVIVGNIVSIYVAAFTLSNLIERPYRRIVNNLVLRSPE